MSILLLGGTREARELAEALDRAGQSVIVSLAGATQRPAPQAGQMRVGGFGGVAGLVAYLRDAAIDRVIDATHPFAAQISAHAAAAATQVGVPLLQVRRPEWPMRPGWDMVADLDAAAAALEPGTRVFLATGRGSLSHFADRGDVEFLARVIDDLPGAFPLAKGRFLVGHPPFSVEQEMATLSTARIDALVSRNAGGTGGLEKIVAAERLGIRVIMVKRPALPEVPHVADIRGALDWVAEG